jgi:hypothetical protein
LCDHVGQAILAVDPFYNSIGRSRTSSRN